MEPRKYRDRSGTQQETRNRSRSPEASRTVPQLGENLVDERSMNVAASPSETVSADRNKDLKSTAPDSSQKASKRSEKPRDRFRVRAGYTVQNIGKDRRRQIWVTAQEWGGRHPRYPNYNADDTSADEEEMKVRGHLLEERMEKKKQVDESLEAQRVRDEAEQERRRGLSPGVRAAEDGASLLDEILSDAGFVVVLEYSASNRAKCRAEDCIETEHSEPTGPLIVGDYRIRLEMPRNYEKMRVWDTKHYYHVPCFERMIDLQRLFPAKLKLAGGPGSWGIILRRWYERDGVIDLAKIDKFIHDKTQWDKRSYDWFWGVWNPWSEKHRDCTDEIGRCGCSPEPHFTEREPRLFDYESDEDRWRVLSDVLEHPRHDFNFDSFGLVFRKGYLEC